MMDRDFSKCDVCGLDLGPDKLHIMIDNGHFLRHTYAHRHHRFVRVEVRGDNFSEFKTQERTDYEIEGLAHAFRAGQLAVGWE